MALNTVGAVYVRVLADTSGLKNDIQKNIGGARGKKAGDAFGDKWVKGVQSRINKINFKREFTNQARAVAANFTDEMRDAVANGNFVADLKINGGPLYDELERIRKTFKLTWKQVAKNFGDALVSEWAKIDAQSDKSARKTYRGLQQAFDDLSFDETLDALTSDIVKRIPLAIRKAIKTTDARSIQFKFDRRAFDDIEEVAKRTGRSIGEIEDAISRRLKPALENMPLLTLDKFNTKVVTLRNSLRRAGTGGAFDILTNMFAVTISGAFGAAKAVESFTRSLIDLVKQGGGLSGILSSLKGLVNLKGLAKLGPALARAGAALAKNWKVLVGLLVILPTLAKGFVGLVGGIIGIIESLVANLINLGGVLSQTIAAGAVLVPIVGALGVAFAATVVGAMDSVNALKAWTKAEAETDPKKRAALMEQYAEALKKLGPNAKAAVEAMKPLTKEFQRIKRSVGEELFQGFAKALERSGPLIQETKSGLEGVANAVGDTVKKFLRLGDSAEFMGDFRTMWEGSEKIIRDLGTAAVDVFVGLQSVFAAIMPLVLDFTGGIKDAAKNFRDWATSAKGENSIKQFFTDAYETAKRVFGILGDIGAIIGILFFGQSAKGAQANFLTDIEGAVDRFRAKLEKMDQDGTLTQWFSDARTTAGELKDAIVDIASELRELNTEENRKTFFDMVKAITAVATAILEVTSALAELAKITGLGTIISVLKAIFGTDEAAPARPTGGIPGSGGGTAGQILSIAGAMEYLGGVARSIAGAVPGIVVGAFSAMAGTVRGILESVGINVDGVVARIRANFANLPALIGAYLGSIPGIAARAFFAILPIVGGVIGTIIARFTSIPRMVQSALSGLPAIFARAMSSAYSTVSGWVSRIIARIRQINVGSLIGGAARALLPGFAVGGITTGPSIVGEAGPEMVIPLTRPLNQIDASVRNVAAMLRGQAGVGTTAANPGAGKIVNNYWTITSQTGNPEAIVSKVMNRELASAM